MSRATLGAVGAAKKMRKNRKNNGVVGAAEDQEEEMMANPLAQGLSVTVPSFEREDETPRGDEYGNGTSGEGQIKMAVSPVDVNGDGIMDVYQHNVVPGSVEEAMKVIRAQAAQLESLRKTLWVGTKTRQNKKERARLHKAFRDDQAATDMFVSPNTLRTLRDLRSRSGEPSKHTGYMWAFLYAMPDDPHNGNHLDQMDEEPDDADDGDAENTDLFGTEEENLKPERGATFPDDDRQVSHECWLMAEKIVTADLAFRIVLPVHGRHIILAVGARHDILVDEAHAMKMQMRLQETKGTMPFNRELIRYFASNHGGITEYRGGRWIARDVKLFENDRHFKPEEDFTEQDQQVQKELDEKVFSSGMAQRLVWSRLIRKGRCDPMKMLARKNDSKSTKTLSLLQKRAAAKKQIPGSFFVEVLDCRGGYRPKNAQVFPKGGDNFDRDVVAQIATLTTVDSNFILKPDGVYSVKKVAEKDKITYSDVIDFVRIMESWAQGPGREEHWVGTMKQCYPLHVKDELAYLEEQWGNFSMLCASRTVGFLSEMEPRMIDAGDPADSRPPQYENNTYSSNGYSVKEQTFPFALFYQPLEEIRNYFGDDVGLYFSWLGSYTRALLLSSNLGLVVMLSQIFYGGISDNPLTLGYSVYVGLWSIMFLETWNRQEFTLRFLWGTGAMSQVAEPRAEFTGELQINPETGKQTMIHTSLAVYYGKQAAGVLVCLLCIVGTVLGALVAQGVGYVPVVCHDTEGSVVQCSSLEAKRNQIIASAMNLIIIGGAGQIFQALAEKMTAWENHRTDAEVGNALVSKNFAFQFFNNYLQAFLVLILSIVRFVSCVCLYTLLTVADVLFYIAYMRELKDPISGEAHPCEGGNCLPELQSQLMVVFTGKTIGKQIAFTLKPFIFKWINSLKDNKLTGKFVKTIGDLTPKAVTQIVGMSDEFGNVQQELKKSRDHVEKQSYLMPYLGTFDDFNDRVIQFGYLVLFAPAYPLAPFLAFINNVVEIRSSGFKYCRGFQRPIWLPKDSIGSWLGVMNLLGFLAVLTNASMISFVGDQQARQFSLDSADSFMSRGTQWHLWMSCMVVEHSVLFLRVVLMLLSPTEAKWIIEAEETLAYRRVHRYKTKSDIQREQRLLNEYKEKMQSCWNILHTELLGKTREDIMGTLAAFDTNRDERVDIAELNIFFRTLGIIATEEERQTFISEIAAFSSPKTGEPGSFQFDDFFAWLLQNDIWIEPVEATPTYEMEVDADGELTPVSPVGLIKVNSTEPLALSPTSNSVNDDAGDDT